MRFIFTGAALVIAALVGAVGALNAAVPMEVSDQLVTAAVQNEFENDFLVSAEDIDVVTSAGVVTLSGTVSNLETKQRAVRIAETVRGVRSVANTLDVRPFPGRAPVQTRAAIEQALRSNPATSDYAIDVAVRDGTAILSGVAASLTESDLAANVAGKVVGVSDIRNEREVRTAEQRSDTEIQHDVEQALLWNALVDDSQIDVTVEDGVVTLSGTVPSAAERRKAREIARVAGVTEVDVSRLDVDLLISEDATRDPERLAVSDEEIELAVNDVLIHDPRLVAAGINVEVRDGSVALTGQVDSMQAKRAAGQDALNTMGVREVDNQLDVRAAESGGSHDVTVSEIRDALANDAVTESWEIEASVTDGMVTLNGVVNSYNEKARAETVVEAIRGVEEVDNDLRVIESTVPPTFDPYYDGPSPVREYGWFDYDPDIADASDEEIREEIESEMWWSPFVDGDQVAVTVESGIATLSGDVDSRSELRAAEENAFEGGAIEVVNQLVVLPE